MSNKLLYIGLNGFAGSGKDTVAKLLSVMLNNKWESFKQLKEYYESKTEEKFAYINNLL